MGKPGRGSVGCSSGSSPVVSKGILDLLFLTLTPQIALWNIA
jgi:hypothetical protein